jgi:hypothetical protein
MVWSARTPPRVASVGRGFLCGDRLGGQRKWDFLGEQRKPEAPWTAAVVAAFRALDQQAVKNEVTGKITGPCASAFCPPAN